jgi:hypothetical protein
LFIRTHETDADDTKLVLNGCHEAVRITFDVEHDPIIPNKAGIPVDALNVQWRSPPGFERFNHDKHFCTQFPAGGVPGAPASINSVFNLLWL